MGFICGIKNTVFLWLFVLLACGNSYKVDPDPVRTNSLPVRQKLPTLLPAANNTAAYLPLLEGKRVGVVANQTSILLRDTLGGPSPRYVHLVDSLMRLGVDLRAVFAPEHGFRGEADAGEQVKDGKDASTGLPIYSLYGANRKPEPKLLEGLDIVVFDIQDVGVRYYTYIATLQLVMEACAEVNVPVLVLDRPNPNAHFIDGPTMLPAHRGFLGLNPIPLVYGMTIGEYARMVNGEGWMEGQIKADLHVVPLSNYTHSTPYTLPVRPSPNLPNQQAVLLYPGLGLFEGTQVNAGRGTDYQFQRYGAPFLDSLFYDFSYVPQPNFGARHPKQEGKRCFGRDLSAVEAPAEVNLEWLLDAYSHATDTASFFNTEGFTKHAGTPELQKQVQAGWSEAAIRESWQPELEAFRAIRSKYLLYD